MRTLEKMAGHPRLYRRGAVYYHRAAVPQDIVETYGKREETFSLRTREYAEALRRVRVEAVRVDNLFDEHRIKQAREQQDKLKELTADQIAAIKAFYYQHLLEEDEEVRLEGFEPDASFEDAKSPEQFDPRHTFEEYQMLSEDMDEWNRYNFARGVKDTFHRSEAEEILSWDGIDLRLDPASPSWPRIIRALQEASIEAATVVQRRNAGDVVSTPPMPSTASQKLSSAPLFSVAVEQWSLENSRGAWSPKVRNDHLAWVKIFMEVTGDKPINSYRKDDARAFKDVLLRLPANSSKKPETRGLPARAAADKAERLGLQPMSASTVNKALTRLGTFWNWAEAHYDDVPTSLMKGLRVSISTSARDQRHPFTNAQMQTLFRSPLFTGCRSMRFYSQPGKHTMCTTAKFWLPLLSLFSGARLNELCQLKTSDLLLKNGIAALNISYVNERKRVKTNGSRRQIPVHSVLEALGFLDFVAYRNRQGEGRLFPELRLDANGYYSHEFSKFFSRYLARIGVKTEKTSFHSFRHNFEDACRYGEVPPHIMDALQGHTERGMAGRYGDGGYRLDLLKKNIERVTYADLDLSMVTKFSPE